MNDKIKSVEEKLKEDYLTQSSKLYYTVFIQYIS